MTIRVKLPDGTEVELRKISLTAVADVDGEKVEIEISFDDESGGKSILIDSQGGAEGAEEYVPEVLEATGALSETAEGEKYSLGQQAVSDTTPLAVETLKKLAEESGDFGSFISKVCQEVHLDKNNEQNFTKAAMAVPHVKVITWENIRGVVKREGGNLSGEDVTNLKRALKRYMRPILLLSEISKIYKERFANKAKVLAETTVGKQENATEFDLERMLEEFADGSKNFQDFMDKVCNWLKLSSADAQFLKEVLEAAKDVGKIAWPNIKAVMHKCTRPKIDNLNSAVQRSGLKAMNLIKALAKYHKYDFSSTGTAVDDESHKALRAGGQTLRELLSEGGIMECFQFVSPLSDALKKLDKTRPVQENIEKVFNVMGLKEQKEIDPELAIKIAHLALTGEELPMLESSIMSGSDVKDAEDVCINSILKKAGIKEDCLLIERMNMHKFINNFRKQYGPADERENVRVIEFLRDLRRFFDET